MTKRPSWAHDLPAQILVSSVAVDFLMPTHVKDVVRMERVCQSWRHMLRSKASVIGECVQRHIKRGRPWCDPPEWKTMAGNWKLLVRGVHEMEDRWEAGP